MDELSSTIAELRGVISSHAYKHTPYITVRKEVIYPLLDRLTTLSSSEFRTAKTTVLQPSTNVSQCDGTDSSQSIHDVIWSLHNKSYKIEESGQHSTNKKYERSK